MICSSENLLLRIVRLLSGGYGLYPNLEEIEGLRSGGTASEGAAAGGAKGRGLALEAFAPRRQDRQSDETAIGERYQCKGASIETPHRALHARNVRSSRAVQR